MEQIIDINKNQNGARVFLFLQGPHGPFFLQLARMLELAGYSCWRVGFNAADKVFWRPQNRFIGFKGPQDEWAETFGNLVTAKKSPIWFFMATQEIYTKLQFQSLAIAILRFISLKKVIYDPTG